MFPATALTLCFLCLFPAVEELEDLRYTTLSNDFHSKYSSGFWNWHFEPMFWGRRRTAQKNVGLKKRSSCHLAPFAEPMHPVSPSALHQTLTGTVYTLSYAACYIRQQFQEPSPCRDLSLKSTDGCTHVPDPTSHIVILTSFLPSCSIMVNPLFVCWLVVIA